MLDFLANYPYLIFGALIGGALVSFCCVVVDRAGTSEGVGGRSHCACGRLLKPWENVPIFGWLKVAGRARCCGKPIPVWFLQAEIIGVVFWTLSSLYNLPGLFGALVFTTLATILARNRKIKKT